MNDDSNSVLDQNTLNQLRQLDKGKGLVCRVIDAFRQTIPGLMTDISGGIADHNPETISFAAHSMKSSSANLGALQFSEQCRRIETLARQGHLQDMSVELVALENLMVPMMEALSQEYNVAQMQKSA